MTMVSEYYRFQLAELPFRGAKPGTIRIIR